MGKLEDVGKLYEARPYPPIHLFSRLQRDQLPLLNYEAGYTACHGTLAGARPGPRILVAGCGTFEAVAVALANPRASILAVDLSARSLEKLRWQARLRGLSARVKTHQGDFQRLDAGDFDYVVATGVLHHLEDPAAGLRALRERAAPGAVFRCMVYSRWGRDLLYGTKELAALLGVREPGELRAMVARLPADHPYRAYLHLYSDAATDAGLCDGYLHPCDTPFDALSLRDFLGDLRVGAFLHRPEGQPGAADQLAHFSAGQGSWERLAVLEALGQLEENFCFFAAISRSGAVAGGGFTWNPALPRRGKYFSRLLGEAVEFDQSGPLPGEHVAEKLRRALFLLPGAP